MAEPAAQAAQVDLAVPAALAVAAVAVVVVSASAVVGNPQLALAVAAVAMETLTQVLTPGGAGLLTTCNRV
jgi:hypothetical protein